MQPKLDKLNPLTGLARIASKQQLAATLTACVLALLPVLPILAAFARVDLPLQRLLHKQRLKVSRQDLKQAQKEAEGNLEAKAALKISFLIVTHDPRLAARCGRVIDLVDGQIERDEAVSPAVAQPHQDEWVLAPNTVQGDSSSAPQA